MFSQLPVPICNYFHNWAPFHHVIVIFFPMARPVPKFKRVADCSDCIRFRTDGVSQISVLNCHVCGLQLGQLVTAVLARESKVTGGTVGLLLQTRDQEIALLLPIKAQSAPILRGPSRRVVLHRRHFSFFLSPLHRELALKRTLRTKLNALEFKISPFLALSTPRFAIKASLFSVFRDLRDSLNNIPGFAIFHKTLHRFCKIPFNFANS